MRIDDIERLVKAHNDLVGSVAQFRDSSNSIHYQLSESVRASQEIAKAISGVLTLEARINP